MTSYSATNTVDIFSPTAPGQVNLFNTAGTFAVQFRAPATVTSYTISLPPTVGSTGQFCRFTSATALAWVPTPTPTTIDFPTARRYFVDSVTKLSTTSTVNVVADRFLFRGTSISDNRPLAVLALLDSSIASSTTCNVTITDITNATTIINSPQVPFTNANQPSRRELGTPTNLSTGPAIWEVLIRRTAGVGTVDFYELQVIGDDFVY